MTIDDLFDRRVPLAIVAALLMQGGCAVWWAATKDSDDRFQQQRLTQLEHTIAVTNQDTTLTLERLTRIEARVEEENRLLDRIEKQIAGSR